VLPVIREASIGVNTEPPVNRHVPSRGVSWHLDPAVGARS